MDTLIGRETELAELRRRVDEGARLLTLVGPPGAGKTRLLRELSRDVIEVSFARSEDELLSAIAHALGIPLDSGDHLARIAAAALGRRLYIDNVEQALTAAQSIVARLLRDTDAAFVITSRERLALADEVVVTVGPLAVDDAIALFFARATIADDRAAAREIVERLDRLPFAIELAAARTRVLKPAALLERLRDATVWLGGRDPRRETLAKAIEWSWELLSEEEKRSLSELSIFIAPFPVEVGEATLSTRSLDVIERLVEQSLVHSDGERLTVYESVREIALARDPDPSRTRARRASAVVALAERHAALCVGARERAALDALSALAADLEASIRDRVLEDPPLAARGLLAMEPLVHHRGPLDRFIALCTSVLERFDDRGLFRARGEARRLAGDVRGAEEDLLRAGDDPHALRILLPLRGASEAELAAVLLRATNPRTHAEILGRLGDMRLAASDYEGARAHHARALAVALAAGSGSLEAIARCNLGAVASSEGRFSDAREHLYRARELWRALKNRRLEGVALEHLVAMHHDAGEIDLAIAASDEARAIHRAVGDRLFEGPSLFAAGCLEMSRDRIDDAETLLRAAIDACVATRNERFEQFARAWLGVVAFARGNRAVAGEMLRAVRVPDGDVHLAVFVDCWLAVLEGRKTTVRGALSDLVAIVDGTQVVARSAEGRVAARLLRTPALVIAEDGRFFERGGARVDLVRRASLRRIVATLLAHRRASPGVALAIDELVEAGWPGERLRADAALARVYTAVRTLRKLGLEGVLRTAGEGYLFDPDIEVRIGN